jgi:hypothetical protein
MQTWRHAIAVGLAATLAVASLRAQDAGPNLVTNGGFEEDAAGSVPQGYGVWRSDDRGVCAVAEGIGRGSRRSLKVAGASSLACQYTIDVLPAETYVLESFCRQDGQGIPTMVVYWKDAKGQWNWPAGMTKESYKPFGVGWRKAVARVQVPAQGVAKMTALLCVDEQESDQDTAWFDDLSIRKTAPTQAPRPEPRRILPLPAQPLEPGDDTSVGSHEEVLNTLRMGVFRYSNVSREEADEQIRQMRVILYFNTGDPEAVRRLAKLPFRTGEPEIRVVERHEE